MTHQLDSRTTGTVTAFMDDVDHPLRRSTFTPVEGIDMSATADSSPAEASEIDTENSAEIDTNDSVEIDPELEKTVPYSLHDDIDLEEALAAAQAKVDEAAATAAERAFPLPPERGSLDDDDLVPLVDRHSDDTATVDLIGILQAQMELRAAEAARFAAWESTIRSIGTDEALEELERTRLHFTGVIPMQTGPQVIPASSTSTSSPKPIVTASSAPAGSALVPERIIAPETEAAVIPTGTAPSTAPGVDATTDSDALTGENPTNPHLIRARSADESLLAQLDEATGDPVPTTHRDGPALSSTRILVVALSAISVAVVVVALVITALGSAAVVAAVLAAFAVPAAAWLGIVGARVALRSRRGVPGPVTTRTTWALIAGLVVGTAVGEGVVTSTVGAFSWQGYLLSLLQVHGLHLELSVVAGIVAALVIGFVVVVLVDRRRDEVAS